MQTALPPRFYRWRKHLIVLACLAPLAAAGLIWMLVNRVLLAPTYPGPKSPAAVYYEFMSNERGLPQLNEAKRIEFVHGLAARAGKDDAFADQFVAAMKDSPKDQQAVLRSNLIDAFKPSFLADVRRWKSLEGDAQRTFLDEKIVEYKQNEQHFKRIKIEKAFGVEDKGEMLNLLMNKTTESERNEAFVFLTAMGKRVAEIQADDELKKQFDARIAGP